MATPDAPCISHYVNDAGAYVLSISAVPDEHLRRPLIVHVGDDTVLDESTGGGWEELGWCAWCEEAQSPTYLRHEGHDTECPLAPPSRGPTRPGTSEADPMTPHQRLGAASPDPAPMGKCRICGDDSWRADELGPVHPCCVIHARENPGRPCLACEASRKARRRS